MKLEKYFTNNEIEFIKTYAQQNNLKEEEAVIRLAKEMIETYTLKYLSGQQVLALIDLLAMKIPMWINTQLMALRSAYQNVRLTAQAIKSVEAPSLTDLIIEYLKNPETSKELMGFVSQLVSSLGSLFSGKKEVSPEEPGSEDESEFL